MGWLEAFGGEFGVADDRGEDVVEIVGDAAGESAEGFHFVHLSELLLHALLFVVGGFGGNDFLFERDVMGDGAVRTA